MFSSGVTAEELIQELQNEVDIALPIPEKAWLQWLTSLEQLLYSEIIQEQDELLILLSGARTASEQREPVKVEVNLSNAETAVAREVTYTAPPEARDVYTVFADGIQLIETSLASEGIFSNTWRKAGGELVQLWVNEQPQKVIVVCFVRPRIKDNVTKTDMVWVPYEFLDLVKAKLRGEAYKLANEDVLAAKWINDYNALLSSFQEWMARRKPMFGM